MSWFTLSSSAPDVATVKDAVTETVTILSYSGNVTTSRVVTTTQREKRGMVNAAADSAVTALAADSTVSDVSKYAIGGGGYNVRYTVRSTTAWA